MIEKVTLTTNDKLELELTGPTPCHDLNPKALMLLAAAKCAGLTVLYLMKKERMTPKRLEITVAGDMSTDTVQADTIFRSFNVVYNVDCGPAENQIKAEHAITLTHDKLCGMMQMLRKVAPVTHGIAIVSTEPAKA